MDETGRGMVLVDTSVWIDHFRASNSRLRELLETCEVAIHPYVIGELAWGGLPRRGEVITLMQALPAYSPVLQEEYLHFIDIHKLAGSGIGFVDIHLLASALLNSDFLWTLDRRLQTAARKFKIAYTG